MSEVTAVATKVQKVSGVTHWAHVKIATTDTMGGEHNRRRKGWRAWKNAAGGQTGVGRRPGEGEDRSAGETRCDATRSGLAGGHPGWKVTW